MLVETEKMIPVTKLQRELTQTIKVLSETKEPIYILKNNTLTAVMISAEEYTYLKEVEEVLEHFEMADSIKIRMQKYNRKKNISWEKIKKDNAL